MARKDHEYLHCYFVLELRMSWKRPLAVVGDLVLGDVENLGNEGRLRMTKMPQDLSYLILVVVEPSWYFHRIMLT